MVEIVLHKVAGMLLASTSTSRMVRDETGLERRGVCVQERAIDLLLGQIGDVCMLYMRYVRGPQQSDIHGCGGGVLKLFLHLSFKAVDGQPSMASRASRPACQGNISSVGWDWCASIKVGVTFTAKSMAGLLRYKCPREKSKFSFL